MRALFLDIDGVVNSEETLAQQYMRSGKASLLGIDPYMALIVGRIILETDCKLVISSSWRNWPESLKQIEEQIYPEIYGVTPNHKSGFRGSEVREYLLHHPEITHYAILDDESDFYINQPLFKTEWKTGINQEIADSVIKHLLSK